ARRPGRAGCRRPRDTRRWRGRDRPGLRCGRARSRSRPTYGPLRGNVAVGVRTSHMMARYRARMPATVRPIRPEEQPAWFKAFSSAFYIWLYDANALATARRDHFDLTRMIAAFEGDRIVGTLRTFTAQLTLPGGARVPVNSVTAVATLPTHRRRGVLSGLMADDVERSAARGDAASVLISAEWPIYGRFGFGPA